MEPVNLLEYETLARQKLPNATYDFVAGGTEDEATVASNRAGFQRIWLRPRVLVDVSNVETSTQVLGQHVPFPVLLAPAGGQLMLHPQGELASAKAAASAGAVFVLSTTSSFSLEEVAEASDGPRWFQLHFNPDREVTRQLVERAQAHGYRALCVTVDMQAPPKRERDLRNQPRFVPAKNLVGLVDPKASLSDPALTWKDIDWLRSRTSMPLLLKGILTAEDARLAIEHGVAAIVVSNHGGRQLDGVPASIDALPEIVEAVDGRVEVLLDGGVRRGTDVVKALALGAKAVLIGRPYLWGLAVGGESGVRRVLELLKEELKTAMALAASPSLAAIDRSLVQYRPP